MMKKDRLNILTFIGISILAAGTAIAGFSAGSGISQSTHDINFMIPDAADAQGRVCIFCHIGYDPAPAGSVPTAVVTPLWSHLLSTTNYTPYASGTFSYKGGQTMANDPLIGPSRLCMSCHDGMIALESYCTTQSGPYQTGTHFMSNGASTYFGAMPVMESDGLKTHPLGFDATAVNIGGAQADDHLWPNYLSNSYRGNMNNVTVQSRLFQGQYFTCSTCHDVHNELNDTSFSIKTGTQHYVLLGGQTNSALCITCHNQAESAYGTVPVTNGSPLGGLGGAAGSGIFGSVHNINYKFGPYFEDVQDRLCAFCHTPHHAYSATDPAPIGPVLATSGYAPLWSHGVSTANYTPYASDSFDPKGGQSMAGDPLIGPSRLCMSCHDGTVALDTYYGATGTHFITNGANTYFGAMPLIELDGVKTHPIGFDATAVDTGGAQADSHLWPNYLDKQYRGNAQTLTPRSRLFANQYFTCSTCHDVHNKRNDTAASIKPGTANYFLLGGQTNSALCITCHNQAEGAYGTVPVTNGSPIGGPPTAGSGVYWSAHNINYRIGPAIEDIQDRLCAYCHTPHHAYTANDPAPIGPVLAASGYAPLWSHGVSTANYTPYASDSFNPKGGQSMAGDPLIGPSRLCMSCHDGTIAIDSYYGIPGSHFLSNGPRIDVDGTKSHPIGFDATAVSTGGAQEDPRLKPNYLSNTYPGSANGTLTVQNRLFAGQYFTCSTCHDVHNKLNDTASSQAGARNYLLLGGRTTTTFCLTCHTNVDNSYGHRVDRLTVPVTVQSAPAGLSITVDDYGYTAPQTFPWEPGSSHTIAATSPQNGSAGTRYSFANWSDGGDLSHVVMTPSLPATYTANFLTNYTVAATITGNGSINSGDGIACSGSPQAGTCSSWYVSGDKVTLMAAVSNSVFNGWGGACAPCATNLSCPLTVDSAKTCSAIFTMPSLITVTGVPLSFSLLQPAYAAAGNGAVIKAQVVTLLENLLLDTVGKAVSIKGGFESSFTTQTGYTTLQGKLTIGKGGLMADRLIIK